MTDISNILGMRVVEKLYDDALSPSVKQIGKATENVVKTLLIAGVPIQISGAAYDWISRRIEEKFRAIPEDQRQPVHPAIAAPVIDQLRYYQEDEPLAEMFVQLLATAMNKDTANRAHPAFAKILGQLAPDEVLMLHLLTCRTYGEVYESDLNLTTMRFSEQRVTWSNFPKDRLAYPKNFYLYISHLISLNLVVFPSDVKAPTYDRTGKVQTGERRWSTLHLTDFGIKFMEACDPICGKEAQSV